MLRGEAGIGKTRCSTTSPRAPTAGSRGVGVESEMELAFGGLHQLCAPLRIDLDSLPGPQRDALSTAFGRRGGDAPDRFLVGLAVLTLLSDVAEEQPLVWIVDDAQWLDEASSQTLAFVARRLRRRVGRHGGSRCGTPPARRLRRARRARRPRARASATPGRCSRRSWRARSTTASATASWPRPRGNPLALLELPRGLTPAEMAGGFGLPYASSLAEPDRGELPPPPRAAPALDADCSCWSLRRSRLGDPVPVWRAAGALGVELGRARRGGGPLVEFGGQVRFRHPLVRSAVVPGGVAGGARARAPRAGRRDGPEVDPDRRAWHRAHATVEADEDVAAELERSAGRAQAPRRPGRGRGFPGARGGADARTRAPRPPRARRGTEQAARRRAGCRAAAPRLRRGRTAR